jgi:hypothetical protein
MNRLITGSLIHDSEPITSLLNLISESDKNIASRNAATNCLVCFNKIVLIEIVSGDEKNAGSIKFNIILTIAAGFQICVHKSEIMAVIT